MAQVGKYEIQNQIGDKWETNARLTGMQREFAHGAFHAVSSPLGGCQVRLIKHKTGGFDVVKTFSPMKIKSVEVVEEGNRV